MALGLPQILGYCEEKNAQENQPSLFYLTVSNENKSFITISQWRLCYKTFYSRHCYYIVIS
jgi:hypothetical protein